MIEWTKKIVNSIVCRDPDGNSIIMKISSSNPNLKVNYNSQTNKLELDASSWNLPDWVNKNVNATLTCSDGDLNTTKDIEVVVQDEANDQYLTYTTNIPTSIVANANLEWNIILNDPDGQLDSSYTFDLFDDNNNSVYTWVIEDNNSDWNYTFSVNLWDLDLPAWNYTFRTEAINPVVWWENPQDPVVIEQNITLEAPTFSLLWPTSWDDGGSYKISLDTNQDLSKLTFRYRWSYNENWDWQDYDWELTPGSTAMGGILTLDNNWNLIIDTTVTWYWDGTSMWSWDWIEFEVEDESGTIKTHRFTVN